MMKEYTIYIETPATDAGDTICHSILVQGESKDEVLTHFLKDSLRVYASGLMEVLAFHNQNYLTIIPLNKILQIEVREIARKED